MATGDCGSGAIISGDYRYFLWRFWGRGPRLLWVMLNPGTAGATNDDPTLKRCIDFSKRWGFGGLEVVNLFAFRTPYIQKLRAARNPVGTDNDQHVEEAAKRGSMIVVGWGGHGDFQGRDRIVLDLLRHHAADPLLCLGMVQNGCPRHPSRMSQTAILQPYDY